LQRRHPLGRAKKSLCFEQRKVTRLFSTEMQFERRGLLERALRYTICCEFSANFESEYLSTFSNQINDLDTA
jgi:hypothetical protein